jgi:hypothetical protein
VYHGYGGKNGMALRKYPCGLLALFFLRGRKTYVAALSQLGFFDESGIHDDSNITVVGGWVVSVDEWSKFERHWKLLLKKEGLTAFHYADFDNSRREFEGWGKTRKEQVIQSIFKIIDSRDLRGFSGAIHMPEYKGVVSGSGTRLEDRPSPYLICQQYCLEMVSKKIAEDVHYVFDRQDEFDKPAIDNFWSTKNDFPEWGKHMAGIAFESKEQFVPLQYADLLAYETFKRLNNKLFRPDLPTRKSMLALVRKHKSLIGGFIDKDLIRNILEWQTHPKHRPVTEGQS